MVKTCTLCHIPFSIGPADLEFLGRIAPTFGGKRFEIPPPKCCPRCRWQQRLAFRNERRLFLRNCDLTGGQIVSIYPAGTKFPVYNISDWISDSWDACDYGRDFDFSRPFFEQFKQLAEAVPHFNLSIDPNRDQNSDYTNCAAESKNCYLISQAEANEDCYYSRGINNCKSCCDCLRIDRCELCYEGINLSLCYHCLYCRDCESSNDCYFSTNLRSCKNCFACHNLAQKEFCYFNRQLTPGQWREQIAKLQFTPQFIEKTLEESESLRLSTPHRFAKIVNCDGVSGDHLMNCKDAYHCYDSRNLEHCAYVSEVQSGAKYCRDYSICGLDTELVYQSVGCGYSAYRLLFCSASWSNVSELIYCDSCGPAVKNCFGCYGLRRKENCILNRQYSPVEYQQTVRRIIDHMIETGEWGEFFPGWVSSDAYNDTIGQSYFPLTKEEVLRRGWNWRDEEETEKRVTTKHHPPVRPDAAEEAVSGQTLNCEQSGRPYRVIKQELALLKQLGLPLPRLHPEVRHNDRERLRNQPVLQQRHCDNCGLELQTTYAAGGPPVFCEKCYLQTI